VFRVGPGADRVLKHEQFGGRTCLLSQQRSKFAVFARADRGPLCRQRQPQQAFLYPVARGMSNIKSGTMKAHKRDTPGPVDPLEPVIVVARDAPALVAGRRQMIQCPSAPANSMRKGLAMGRLDQNRAARAKVLMTMTAGQAGGGTLGRAIVIFKTLSSEALPQTIGLYDIGTGSSGRLAAGTAVQ